MRDTAYSLLDKSRAYRPVRTPSSTPPSDRRLIRDTRSRSRATHYWLPRSRASCAVCLRGHADMRHARRGALANKIWLPCPSAGITIVCASKRGIASKRCGSDAWPCEHRARTQKAATLPRPPSVFARGRSKTLLQHLDAAGIIAPQQRSTTAASPQRSQAARHAAGSLASTGDSAASASTIEKIWPSKTTTPAAASPNPGLDANNGRKIA